MAGAVDEAEDNFWSSATRDAAAYSIRYIIDTYYRAHALGFMFSVR